MAGVIVRCCLALALASAAQLVGTPVHAHEAVSGFIYPRECCDNRDCRQLASGEVTVGPNYFIWKGHRIAFGSPKIRVSPDDHFHGCEAGFWGDTSGLREVVCFFVPPGT